MSPNKNYLAGRRFEYATMRKYERLGFICVRSAGSHSPFDVLAYDLRRKPVFIQCKKVATEREAHRLRLNFLDNTKPSEYFHQTLEVKIKGQLEPMETTV